MPQAWGGRAGRLRGRLAAVPTGVRHGLGAAVVALDEVSDVGEGLTFLDTLGAVGGQRERELSAVRMEQLVECRCVGQRVVHAHADRGRSGMLRVEGGGCGGQRAEG